MLFIEIKGDFMRKDSKKVVEQIYTNNEIKRLLEQKLQITTEINRLCNKIDKIDAEIRKLKDKQ